MHSDVLHRFLTLTKHIVTDQSAFMFLTNRDYYERLNREEQQKSDNGGSARMTNPVFKTFYNHRIFLHL